MRREAASGQSEKTRITGLAADIEVEEPGFANAIDAAGRNAQIDIASIRYDPTAVLP